jgi:hypothetical protein
MAAVTHALLIAFSIATTQRPAHAQEPMVAQERPSPTSMTLDEGSGANQAASIQYASLDQKANSLCSLRVPDSSVPSSPNKKGAQTAEPVLTYRPLSPRCKFGLFLKQTYSPYTFASAGFQAVWGRCHREMATLWGRRPGLGQAIWCYFGGYRVAEVHSDFCIVDCPASGSSLFSVK